MSKSLTKKNYEYELKNLKKTYKIEALACILVFSQNRQFRRKRSRVKVDAHAIRRGLLLVIRTFDVFGDT